MTRRLVWIVAVSLTLSVVCLLLAAWIDEAVCRDHGADVSVALPWQGARKVVVELPAKVTYRPGANAEAIVTGPADLIRQVQFRDGRVAWKAAPPCLPQDNLIIRLTGPAVGEWRLDDGGALELSGIDQDALRIDIRGKASATASGKVRQLSLDITGSGDADLRDLSAEQVGVVIRGRGQADILSLGAADIEVKGKGDVLLLDRPKRPASDASGSGTVRQ